MTRFQTTIILDNFIGNLPNYLYSVHLLALLRCHWNQEIRAEVQQRIASRRVARVQVCGCVWFGARVVSGRYAYPIHTGDGRYTYRAGVRASS